MTNEDRERLRQMQAYQRLMEEGMSERRFYYLNDTERFWVWALSKREALELIFKDDARLDDEGFLGQFDLVELSQSEAEQVIVKFDDDTDELVPLPVVVERERQTRGADESFVAAGTCW